MRGFTPGQHKNRSCSDLSTSKTPQPKDGRDGRVPEASGEHGTLLSKPARWWWRGTTLADAMTTLELLVQMSRAGVKENGTCYKYLCFSTLDLFCFRAGSLPKWCHSYAWNNICTSLSQRWKDRDIWSPGTLLVLIFCGIYGVFTSANSGHTENVFFFFFYLPDHWVSYLFFFFTFITNWLPLCFSTVQGVIDLH